MISVIVPVYNVENYLDRCIASIVSQSCKDLEIILVDDGSSDSSGNICDEWAKKDSRIIVLHQKNSGVGSARNAALRIAKGNFITFVDSDDYIDVDMYSLLISAMNEKTDISVCGFNKVTENGIIPVLDHVGKNVTGTEAVREFIGNIAWGLIMCNKLFRREVIFSKQSAFSLFCEDLIIGEDALWIISILQKCRGVSYVPKALYYYVERPGSAVYNSKHDKWMESCASRYEAAMRGYKILKSANNPYAYMMYRRCVFSSRDIACGSYCEKQGSIYRKWIKNFGSSLYQYRKMLVGSEDKMFILKNELLYYFMRIHMPKRIVKKLMGVKQPHSADQRKG